MDRLELIPFEKVVSTIYNDMNVSTIVAVMNMLRDKSPSVYCPLKPSNITNIEEVYFEKISGGESIYDHMDCAMMKCNVRVIYTPEVDVQSSNYYHTLQFTKLSKVKDDCNTFFTMFISDIDMSDNKNVYNLSISILKAKLTAYVDFESIMDKFLGGKVESVLMTNFLINIYIAIFMTLDRCFNLKYEDFGDIYDSLFVERLYPERFTLRDIILKSDDDDSVISKRIIEEIYRYSIEEDTDIKFKDIFKKLDDLVHWTIYNNIVNNNYII